MAEYAGLMLGVSAMAQRHVKSCLICGDSKLILKQTSGEWRCRDPNLSALRSRVCAVLESFDSYELRYVPRANNATTCVSS